MDIYAGLIHFSPSSKQPPLRDIHLYLPSPTSNTISLSASATLTYLALVNPNLIPLHLAVGPNLEVWTNDEDTVEWFAAKLLCYQEAKSSNVVNESVKSENHLKSCWELQNAQSDLGVLLRVEQTIPSNSERPSRSTDPPRITEVLLYATVVPSDPEADALPTPPSSTPPDIETSDSNIKKELRVLALPLSSDLLYRTSINAAEPVPSPPLSPTTQECQDQARILPPPQADQAPIRTTPRKRARIADLFDNATERRKKARRKGGEGVSREMAGMEGSEHSIDILNAAKRKQEEAIGDKQASESQHKPSIAAHESSRPSSAVSRKDQDPLHTTNRKNSNVKRATLSRMTSTFSEDRSQDSVDKPTELRNKDALSRIVMAGMRIYGLQQREKTTKSQNNIEMAPKVPGNTTQIDTSGEIDEYKLVYHQTFKGACFAFRRHISKSILNQEDMRDVVDKLLALYCNDPLPIPTSSSSIEKFGQEAEETSPFAARTGQDKQKKSEADENFSTPRVRRRFRDGERCDDDDVEKTVSPRPLKARLGYEPPP